MSGKHQLFCTVPAYSRACVVLEYSVTQRQTLTKSGLLAGTSYLDLLKVTKQYCDLAETSETHSIGAAIDAKAGQGPRLNTMIIRKEAKDVLNDTEFLGIRRR